MLIPNRTSTIRTPGQPGHHTTTPTMYPDDWEDWADDEPDPDDPRWYVSAADDDSREALTAAERNPSLCRL